MAIAWNSSTMNRLFIHKIYLILSVLFLLAALIPEIGFSDGFSPVEGRLYELIENSRDSHISVNTVLNQVSRVQASELFVNEFASSLEKSVEYVGYTAEDAGYQSEDIRQMTAMIVFSNYLAGDAAADLLFRSLTDKAATENGTGELYSEKFSEIGLHVMETSVNFSGTRFNVYLVIVNFAVPLKGVMQSDIMEKQLLVLMNQGRKTPDTVLYLQEMGDVAALPSGPLFPMEIDTPEAEMTVNFFTESMNSENWVANLFSFMLQDRTFLNADFNAADIDIAQELILVEGKYEMSCTATIRFARIPIKNDYLYGAIYSDLNGNGLYDAGEGITWLPVFINDVKIHARTGSAGQLMEAVETDRGVQLILFPANRDMVIVDIDNAGRNEFFLIDI